MLDTCAHHCEQSYGMMQANYISCEETGAQAFSWSTNRVQYIVFRGTSGLRDIIADFDIRRTRFHGAQVHHGFCTQYTSIADQIRSNITSSVHTIVCTGHSLGGALATLAAIDLHDTGKRIMCYTFGSPRVGDERMVQLFQDRVHTSFRVFHECDPIHMFPISHRFTHVHGGYRIGRDTLVKHVKKDRGFLQRVFSIFKHHDLSYHSMHLYALHMENLNMHRYQYGLRDGKYTR